MTKVWITLTEPSAARIASQLSRRGFTSVCESVTEIEFFAPKFSPPDNIRTPDLLIFLSQHAALHYLDQLHCDAYGASKFLAIGASTAEILRRAGLAVVEPAHASSEGLLASPLIQNIKANDQVWIVCGEAGRDILQQSLATRCNTSTVTLYRRGIRAVPKKEVADADIILVGSAQGFIEAAKVWQSVGGNPAVSFIVPSARVAELGLELGLTQVVNAGGMGSELLLKAVARIEHE